MLVVQDLLRSTDHPRGCVATIGNFDGLHRGQRAVLDRVIERARELDAPAALVTFEPHPVSVLSPEDAPPRITTARQRERLLEAMGLDVLLVVPFTPDFARLSAESFVRDVLVGRMGVREVHVGSRFGFGSGRGGDLDLLRRLGEELGFAAHGVEEVATRDGVVSSTRIRKAVEEGRVEDAAQLLGRPFSLEGVIVRGDRMGKRLGWPTINVTPEGPLEPLEGVYATRVFFPSFPATFDAATNIGTRPTVYENYQRVVESHILDFGADVYGERVEIHFHRRLRDEMLFDSVMALSSQIRRDVEITREYFASLRRSNGATV
ncbi:MAG: bifunctional riboflavin kinase/FAD synthetase [Acidobacteria bacterium]|nr:bifunctional riboflavin kinase/FAD synthetase [Acidobacteriota bacterium]